MTNMVVSFTQMRFEQKVETLRIKKYNGKETKAFLDDVTALASGEAFEYLMGQVIFCDATVDLSYRPMIPRPETEFWVREAINRIKNAVDTKIGKEKDQSYRMLDMFSGSGCVALGFAKACAKNIPTLEVDCIELAPRLKDQILLSVHKNKLDPNNIRVFTGSIFEGASGHYDTIFAVPPYVPSSMQEEVMQELHAEDPLSFFDKEDGFYYHTQIFKNVKNFLKQDGTLYVEFDITQREKIETLARECGFTTISFLKDPYGHECAISCTM